MKDLELLKSLEAIFHLETRSFVRYVYEAASPLAKDDWGRMLAGTLILVLGGSLLLAMLSDNRLRSALTKREGISADGERKAS